MYNKRTRFLDEALYDAEINFCWIDDFCRTNHLETNRDLRKFKGFVFFYENMRNILWKETEEFKTILKERDFYAPILYYPTYIEDLLYRLARSVFSVLNLSDLVILRRIDEYVSDPIKHQNPIPPLFLIDVEYLRNIYESFKDEINQLLFPSVAVYEELNDSIYFIGSNLHPQSTMDIPREEIDSMLKTVIEEIRYLISSQEKHSTIVVQKIDLLTSENQAIEDFKRLRRSLLRKIEEEEPHSFEEIKKRKKTNAGVDPSSWIKELGLSRFVSMMSLRNKSNPRSSKRHFLDLLKQRIDNFTEMNKSNPDYHMGYTDDRYWEGKLSENQFGDFYFNRQNPISVSSGDYRMGYMLIAESPGEDVRIIKYVDSEEYEILKNHIGPFQYKGNVCRLCIDTTGGGMKVEL